MEDTSHLERMGRELKCPICLSLLNNAVSLTCNHAFCNCCIEKSMKSASCCPVCKVPFRRREIRPAPHMDNLVSIYKSMEVASGVNIFVTQIAPSARTSGTGSHLDDERICEIQDNSKTCIDASPPDSKKKYERKGSRESSQVDCSNNSFNPVKPSFPAKKRVHVPQCPPSEKRSKKLANEMPEITNNELESSSMLDDKPVFGKKGEPLFIPFFWLRDEDDVEKTSQQTYGDQILETPPDAPCFSDIKDSDDEIPSEMPPEMGTCISHSDKDLFDSEMFEWTQRACSPELHSSPVRMQAEDATECGRPENNRFALPSENAITESKIDNRWIMTNATDKVDTTLPCSSSTPRGKIVSKTAGMSRKRAKTTAERRPSKQTKKITIDASRSPKELGNVPGENLQEKFGKSGNGLNVIKKTSKSKKKVCFDADVTRTTENVSNSSSGNFFLIQGNNKLVVDLPVLTECKKYEKRVRKRSFNLKAKKTKATKKSMALNQSEGLPSRLQEKLSSDEDGVFDMGRTLKRCKANCSKRKTNLKMVTFPEGKKLGGKLADDTDYHNMNGKVASKDASKDAQKFGAAQGNCSSRDVHNSSRLESVLSYSAKVPNKICCGFCQSAEDSEASGVMVHYLKGKLVAGDKIEGPNVIHSHKNCTEWAPNVFFEDDYAINLEAELTRSRKIRCGLCRTKGAALGCFERSCRKSFHVPCAKMSPQFRWDYENFVMLCPLHACCKLPCEEPASQSYQKKSAPKRDSNIHQPQGSKDVNKENLQWKSHKKAKDFILCCSGLTDTEKEVVSEFEKLTRITMLKNWDLSVTHVVASTDDNGACKRTLKFLMGVLEGKWIVNIEWVKACIKSMELVDEQHYEIKADIHGIKDGPNMGRLRNLQKRPKLFNGYKFYFIGDFVPSYKGYLQDLVIAAGGTVLNRKPVPKDQDIFASDCSTVFIVYSREQPENCGTSKRNSTLTRRHLDAASLATSTGAVAVTNSWLLNTIAGCKLQNLPK